MIGNLSSFDFSVPIRISSRNMSADIRKGGEWSPLQHHGCRPAHKVAVIIPFRDRLRHLQTLLKTLIPILKAQRIHFRVFVVEQVRLKIFLHKFNLPWKMEWNTQVWGVLSWCSIPTDVTESFAVGQRAVQQRSSSEYWLPPSSLHGLVQLHGLPRCWFDSYAGTDSVHVSFLASTLVRQRRYFVSLVPTAVV